MSTTGSSYIVKRPQIETRVIQWDFHLETRLLCRLCSSRIIVPRHIVPPHKAHISGTKEISRLNKAKACVMRSMDGQTRLHRRATHLRAERYGGDSRVCITPSWNI